MRLKNVRGASDVIKASKYVIEKYNWEKITKKTEKLYKKGKNKK